MYTLDLPVLYSEEARGERISGQHANRFHDPPRFSRNAVPVGFCSGGFTSTAGYVPGNEARDAEASRATSLPLAVPFQRASSVFIRTTQKSLATFLSKPFGSNQGVNNIFVPSEDALKQCVTALLASPRSGQTPVSNLTL